ncbi:ABC transporter permease [uncultured Streptococcus sp.]|uniref:ABC transporter permease n=1 Tax=uncultured Streptococcus sp. TaxID=83427 RepID=UPI002600EE96|nr:ABC transporter permease [uncultured Streptococcus sp.]
MNWNHVWELFKINLLYANPQAVTNLQKRQEKKKKANFSIVNAMLRQQLLILVVFTVVYSYLFVGVDYKANPGVLTLYLLTFSIIGLLQTFTALYSIFYDSKDSKVYLSLPLKPSEVFLAKTLSGFMVGMSFMVPILSLLILAYWQFIGPLGIPVGLFAFILCLFVNLVLSVVLANSIGTMIVRSSRQKLYSSILMTLSTILIMLPIMMVGFLNGYIKGAGHVNFPLLPYLRGYYDVVAAPLSPEALLNFYLPLILVLILGYWFYKVRMPRYFHEAIYNQKARKPQAKAVTRSQRQVLVRHHLSTFGNSTLIINTYVVPVLYMIMLGGGAVFLKDLGPDYFGLLLLVGIAFGFFSAQPTSFLGVATSLEGTNFDFIRSLPINMGDYLRQKFWIFYGLQVSVSLLLGGLGLIFLAHLHPVLVLSFIIGFLVTTYLAGGYFFERDLKLLEINWQEVTQLFNRGGGQWLYMGIFVLTIFIVALLGGVVFFASKFWIALVVNTIVSGLIALIALIVYLFVDRRRWKRIRAMFFA